MAAYSLISTFCYCSPSPLPSFPPLSRPPNRRPGLFLSKSPILRNKSYALPRILSHLGSEPDRNSLAAIPPRLRKLPLGSLLVFFTSAALSLSLIFADVDPASAFVVTTPRKLQTDELATVRLFQENTPSVVYITNLAVKDMKSSAGNDNCDLAVDKAIKLYDKHIKMEEDVKMYPLRGATECLSGVEMFHILSKTTAGQKYVFIYVAPQIYGSTKLDDGALKLAFFKKIDKSPSLPLHCVVGDIRWPVSPRNDPLITAAARFALAQHNPEEKLADLVRANAQMVGGNEIFRMTFKSEGATTYDAIVLVPRNKPEDMELVKCEISIGWGMYGRLVTKHGSMVIVPHIHPVRRHRYLDEDEDVYHYTYHNEDDASPRLTMAAARFALAQHNKEDQVRQVVEGTRRTYSGYEILSMKFDGELDGSRFYEAIVLVPVKNPENMSLAYFGRNGDECDCPSKDGYSLEEDGFDECSMDDPRVTEAAQLALTTYRKEDKLVRVVKAVSKNDSSGVSYRVRLVGEDHPSRTYVAIVSVPANNPQRIKVEYVARDGLKYAPPHG